MNITTKFLPRNTMKIKLEGIVHTKSFCHHLHSKPYALLSTEETKRPDIFRNIIILKVVFNYINKKNIHQNIFFWVLQKTRKTYKFGMTRG